VRHAGPRDQFGILFLDARIEVIAVVAVRESEEFAVAERGHVVGHEIVAELVPLVDRDPQLAAVRLPGHADRIADAGREYACLAGLRIDLENAGAVLLGVDAILAGIAVRADTDEQVLAVTAGDNVLGPVMV